jgi:hypothetical protein
MVTPQLKQVFADEGVGVIGLNTGSEYLAREIATETTGPVEVVIIGALATPTAHDASAQTPAPSQAAPSSPATSPTPSAATPDMHLAFERHLSLAGYPVLRSHVMKGRAVMPLALIVEWMAHGAMHDNPGMGFVGFDNLQVFKAVTLDAEDAIPLDVYAAPADFQDNGDAIVTVELRGKRRLETGEQETGFHARADVILGQPVAAPAPSTAPQPAGAYDATPYQDERLFHGPDLHGIELVRHCDGAGIVVDVKTAPAPAAWVTNPMRSAWLADPLALDSAFQAMILWAFDQHGDGSLPVGVKNYRQFVRSFPKDGVRVISRIEKAGAHQATAAIEMLDHQGVIVAKLEGYACVIDPSLAETFKHNSLAQSVGS